MDNFKKLGISNEILRSIDEQGFENPTEIQEKSIPLILEGEDVIAGSATGSGKTLAFASGIIQHSDRGYGIQALILTPTRELAEQVANTFKKFSKYDPLKVISIYGGVGINPQIKGLKTAEVVVATPGRLLDHINRNTIKFNNVKTLVLDEADHMFDMGFIKDVEKIIQKCPQSRQTLLFSATVTKDVVKLSRKYMNNPVQVSVESYIDPAKLNQIVYKVSSDMKLSLLVHLLKNESSNLGMVFCNTKRNTDKVAKKLRNSGIDAIAIHGGLTQNKRNNIMQLFHSKKVSVLVCTDVAGRGLDIKGVSHVYNYEIPRESKQYIHRIGRTARAGTEGKAINLLCDKDRDNYAGVLRDNDVYIKEIKMPTIERISNQKPDRELPKPGNKMDKPASGKRRQHKKRNHNHNRSRN